MRVEYIDVFSDRMDEFPLARQAVFDRVMPLPVVAFDGQPRMVGGISVEMISAELEKRGCTGLE